MIILFEENIFFSASGFLKSGSQQNEGRVVRACPSSMLTFFFKKRKHYNMKLFHFGRNICFLMKLFFHWRKKKKMRKINQGDAEKQMLLCAII